MITAIMGRASRACQGAEPTSQGGAVPQLGPLLLGGSCARRRASSSARDGQGHDDEGQGGAGGEHGHIFGRSSASRGYAPA